MYYGHRRLVPRDPARLGQAIAEIEVLHVHPEAFVERTNLVERGAADEHEGAVDGINGSGLDVRRSVLRKPARRTVASPDEEEVGESASDCRKRTPGRVVEAAVVSNQPTPRRTNPGAFVH